MLEGASVWAKAALLQVVVSLRTPDDMGRTNFQVLSKICTNKYDMNSCVSYLDYVVLLLHAVAPAKLPSRWDIGTISLYYHYYYYY